MVRAFVRASFTVARAALAEGLVMLADRIAPHEQTEAVTQEFRDYSGQVPLPVELSPRAQAMIEDATEDEEPPHGSQEEPPLRGSLQWRERNG